MCFSLNLLVIQHHEALVLVCERTLTKHLVS